ncbi:helix-turn-helix domain-containing protein [Sphingobium baderi]|uniref:HTH araC/xylS-type domain-containing protein n=1 Tax=Sphingobium baderi TaxID=1332080 RepID=A0A0S3F3C7_9SPHN|nr:AraC family transcriptional regulator [Sphingobium baderi]ALR22040.1 hypothetical protein ATN00_18765 [Sphingobium baderi]
MLPVRVTLYHTPAAHLPAKAGENNEKRALVGLESVDTQTWSRFEEDRPQLNAAQSLIRDHTVLSDLLEGIRVEQTSYRLLRNGDGVLDGRRAPDELVGFYFLTGEVEFTSPGAGPIHARKGDYLLLCHGTRYCIRPTSENGKCSIGHLVFSLDGLRARLLFRILPKVLFISGLSQEEMQWQMQLEHLITHHPRAFSTASPAINHRLIEASIISNIQTFFYREGSQAYQIDSPDLVRVYASVKALHECPERAWTIAALADLSSMSKTLFVAKFKDATGMPPARYLSMLRLDRVKELLRARSLSLTQIAHRTGYSTDMALIHAFKRQFGITPGQFRSAHQWS